MDVRASFTDANGQAATAALSVEVSPRPSAGYRPSGFATDGSAEVTDALTAWFGTVPDGATVDLTDLTFWCDRFVKLVNRSLTILGGTLVRKTVGVLAWPAPNPHWWFVTSEITMTGFSVLGTNTVMDQKADYGAYSQTYEFEAAVRAEGCPNLTLDATLIDGVWGDGYQLQPSGSVACDNFRLTGHIDRIGRQGVTPIGTNGYVSVTVDHPRRSLIDLEPAVASWACHDILIERCKGAPIGKPIAAMGRGRVDNITVQDCEWRGSAVPTIYVSASDGSRRSNWVYRRNTSDGLGSPQAAVYFVNVDGVVVEDNVHPVSMNQSRKSATFIGCGGLVAFRRNNVGTGGLYIDNTTPAAGQTVDFTGNTPAQTVRTT